MNEQNHIAKLMFEHIEIKTTWAKNWPWFERNKKANEYKQDWHFFLKTDVCALSVFTFGLGIFCEHPQQSVIHFDNIQHLLRYIW